MVIKSQVVAITHHYKVPRNHQAQHIYHPLILPPLLLRSPRLLPQEGNQLQPITLDLQVQPLRLLPIMFPEDNHYLLTIQALQLLHLLPPKFNPHPPIIQDHHPLPYPPLSHPPPAHTPLPLESSHHLRTTLVNN